ncbi:MAG: hypothetical protein NTV94_09455 [Planctomycetota bacterium]|nr:hypothetical protein [Planctomycetota bacterium]
MIVNDAYGARYKPIEGRYKPIEALVLSTAGSVRYRPTGGIKGSYRIDLHGRTLIVDPRNDYVNDFDTLLAPDGTLKPEAFWLLVRLFEEHGVPLISDAPANEPWEAGRTQWQRRDWREFWAALRGAGAPYPECNGYTLAELVSIWHGSPKHTPASMNMNIFLCRCREGKPQG